MGWVISANPGAWAEADDGQEEQAKSKAMTKARRDDRIAGVRRILIMQSKAIVESITRACEVARAGIMLGRAWWGLPA